jgi:hypothetical protein
MYAEAMCLLCTFSTELLAQSYSSRTHQSAAERRSSIDPSWKPSNILHQTHASWTILKTDRGYSQTRNCGSISHAATLSKDIIALGFCLNGEDNITL